MDDTHPHFQRPTTAAERDALAALLPAYEGSLAPISRPEFDRMMGRLALGYPNAKVSDGEADERLNLYALALGDVPADIIGGACIAALKIHTFFPSIAEMRALCGEFGRRQFRLQRIRHLLARHDKNVAPEPRCTPEEAAAIIASVGLNMEGAQPIKRAMPEWMRDAMAKAGEA